MMGFDDRETFDDDLGPSKGILAGIAIVGVCLLIAATVLFLSFSNARAQNKPTSCSGTAETTAANITFRHPPASFITIVNPSASATLWVSATGTAAANSAESFPLVATGNSATLPPQPTVSIIASAASTPYTCFFR